MLLQHAVSPNVDEMLVADEHGQVVSLVRRDASKKIVPVYTRQPVIDPNQVESLTEQRYSRLVPVMPAGHLGWVRVSYSLDELDDLARGTSA